MKSRVYESKEDRADGGQVSVTSSLGRPDLGLEITQGNEGRAEKRAEDVAVTTLTHGEDINRMSKMNSGQGSSDEGKGAPVR